jgi:hypothetical protein
MATKRNENRDPLAQNVEDRYGEDSPITKTIKGKWEGQPLSTDDVQDYFTPSTMDDELAAEEYAKRGNSRLNGIEAPDLTTEGFGRYVWGGDYAPTDYQGPADIDARLADAENLGPTAFEDISGDPRMKDAQLAALASLQDIGANGMTAQDRANLARIQSEAAQADRGRREAIQQNMAARGMGGSGMSLLAQLQSSQAATDRTAQQGLDVAGMSQARALEALNQAGGLAGNIRGQDFSEAARVAQAKDAVAEFNARNRTQNNQFNAGQQNQMAQYNQNNTVRVGMANNDARNNAGMASWQGRQDLNNKNVDLGNKKVTYGNEISQQRFDNTKGLAKDKAAADKDMADFYNKQVDRTNAQSGAKIGALGKAIGSVFGGMKSDKKTKQDVKPISEKAIEEFLAALKPKSFKYKKEFNDGDDGKKIGFIMQDIEKTKAGKMMARDVEGVKGYDAQSLQGITLAALKHLADKIDGKDE